VVGPGIPRLQPWGEVNIDELNLTSWLPERTYRIMQLQATAATFTPESTANLLLRALQAMIVDAQAAGARLESATRRSCTGGRSSTRWMRAVADTWRRGSRTSSTTSHMP
jgi:hypothetical protein